MKRIILSILTILSTFIASLAQNEFVKGADIGFLSGQEARGQKFYDRTGRERECLDLLQDYQITAVRLRVWVNPRGGDCGKEDVLKKALRAKEQGMEIMINFHYSDSWADPAKQPIPQAWMGHSFEQMKQDLANHTVEVLSYLKENDISVRWVQVGNETSNGLLWSPPSRMWGTNQTMNSYTEFTPMGDMKTHPDQYAGFIAAGYDAVKRVYPEAIVIIHLDNGFDANLYDWNLDAVLKYGGKFDMIGMSLYPYWAMDSKKEPSADKTITDCLDNLIRVSKKYKKDVMIVETGFEVDERHPEVMEEGRRQLSRIVKDFHHKSEGRCRGVFYWEPQCLPGGYKLGAFDSKGAPTVIMDGFVEE